MKKKNGAFKPFGLVSLFNNITTFVCKQIQTKQNQYLKTLSKSKVGNRSRGRPEGSLLNSYYTGV